jgi:hypothetical protein
MGENFGIFKSFGDRLFEGEVPTNIGPSNSYFTSILDLYPNAAVAYSVRLLRGAYTGSAIRVRRSSDNAEQDIGFINGNLNTAALLSFVGTGASNQGFVTTWYDQSTNARNTTQTIAISQPKIVSNGALLTLNGISTIQFDSAAFSTTAFNMSEFSSYTVLKKYNTNTYGGYFRNVPTTGTSFSVFSDQASAWESHCIKFNNGSDIGPYVKRSGTKTLPTNQYLENWIYTNTVRNFFENNSAITTTTGGSGYAGTTLFTLGSVGYTGTIYTNKLDMQEFILYDADQSSNNALINTNINTYYGIY